MAQVAIDTNDSRRVFWSDINFPQLLLGLGEDLDREGLVDTPRRIKAAWEEMLAGYTIDPESVLDTTFENNDGTGFQLCKSIAFTSVCEHHMVPFFGYVDIGYEAKESVVGLSKLARLVDCFAKRLQIQERMGFEIANTLFEAVMPRCVYVLCRAKHMCCKGRGVCRDLMQFDTLSHVGNRNTELLSMMNKPLHAV